MNSSSLNRFLEAQADADSGFETALKELKAGRKTSHWIWYIFPQLVGLGRSPTAKFYGLAGLDEARNYFLDPVLGPRIQAVTAVVREKLEQGILLNNLMGSAVDSAKLASCLTLFEAVIKTIPKEKQRSGHADFSADVTSILRMAEQQGYPRCQFTVAEVTANPS